MKHSDYIVKSLLSALGVVIYVSAVAWLGFNGEMIFGRQNNFLMPLFVLLLFVISASVTGTLVLGKPIQLYWNGHKREAILLFFATLGWLVFFLVVIAAVLLL